MMMKIAHVFGISISTATKAALLATSATTVAGRSLVGGLLKLVPGVNLFAMIASGITAGSLTTALGWSWNRVVQAIANGTLDQCRSKARRFSEEVFELRERRAVDFHILVPDAASPHSHAGAGPGFLVVRVPGVPVASGGRGCSAVLGVSGFGEPVGCLADRTGGTAGVRAAVERRGGPT